MNGIIRRSWVCTDVKDWKGVFTDPPENQADWCTAVIPLIRGQAERLPLFKASSELSRDSVRGQNKKVWKFVPMLCFKFLTLVRLPVRDSADCLLVGHFSFLEPEKVLEPGIQVLATLTLCSLPFRVSAKLEDKPMVSFGSLLPHDFSLKQAWCWRAFYSFQSETCSQMKSVFPVVLQGEPIGKWGLDL